MHHFEAMFAHPKACVLAGLLVLSNVHQSESTRFLSSGFRNDADPLQPHMEVVNKTEIQMGKNGTCLCDLGKFWHWRIHKCVEQGPWGYECGFFPAEHHHRVCVDNLKCQKTADAPDTYTSHGLYHGTANTFPASCVPCTPEDGCTTGEQRHSEECLASITLEGEACQTVRVTVPEVEATASATESHTSDVEGTDATKTATATEAATATAAGVAEATECVTVDEAKKSLGLQDVDEVGEVLASRIIDQGNKLAYEKASAAALKKAGELGLLKAEAAAEAMAETRAAEEARLQAERLAHEAAAWAKEAGENAAAKAAAEARAAALAKEEAKAAKEAAEARRRAEEAAEEAAAQARAAIGSIASGGMRRNQDPGTEAKEPQTYPGEDKNRLRKVTQKDVDGKNP